MSNVRYEICSNESLEVRLQISSAVAKDKRDILKQ